VLILGAGFGGLELATTLSEALGEEVEATVIDRADAFVFGYSKLDVMFGRTSPEAVRLAYRDIAKPGCGSSRRRSRRSTPRTVA
jgi:sulfide:quinone oxidoreductase